MTEREFCYWLKGFFEIMSAGPKTPEKLTLTANQIEMIECHLRSVFSEKIMQSGQISQITIPQQLPNIDYDSIKKQLDILKGISGEPFPKPPYTVTCHEGPYCSTGKIEC